MRPKPTILYVGTYEREYPRNQQLIRLFRQCGCEVVECHAGIWEHYRDKSRGFGGAFGAARLGLSLVAAYARLLVRLISRLRSSDAFVVGYIGQLDMLVLGPLIRLTRKALIFNPLVTLSDTLVEDRSLVGEQTFAARILRLADSTAIRLATRIVVDTDENADYLRRQFSVDHERLFQLHVGADECVFRASSATTAPRNLSPIVRVLFYGKMIPLHGIDTILAAADMLSDEPDISFEIVGTGQQDELVLRFLEDNPAAPVEYLPWVDYTDLPARIGDADCVLGVFGCTQKASRVIPNKVFQAMAMGKTIVTRDSPAVRSLLRDGVSALLVPPGQPEALADAIRRLRDAELRTKLGCNARQVFERNASDQVLSHRLRRLLHDLPPGAPFTGQSDGVW